MAIDIDYVLMYGGYYNKVTGAGPYAADDEGNMTLIGSGSGGGESGGLTNDQLRASAVAVSGPLTNAQMTAVTGAASAAPWDGAAASATIISILKANHALLSDISDKLTQIEVNTNTGE